VAQHDVVRHEKVQISQVLREVCGLAEDDEFSLHHEFSKATTVRDEECITEMQQYIVNSGNPFSIQEGSDPRLRNLVTGKLSENNDILKCTEVGHALFTEFTKERFDIKTKVLMNPIKKNQKRKKGVNTFK